MSRILYILAVNYDRKTPGKF